MQRMSSDGDIAEAWVMCAAAENVAASRLLFLAALRCKC